MKMKQFIENNLKKEHSKNFTKRFKDKVFSLEDGKKWLELSLSLANDFGFSEEFFIYFSFYDKEKKQFIEESSIFIKEDYYTVCKVFNQAKKEIKKQFINN